MYIALWHSLCYVIVISSAFSSAIRLFRFIMRVCDFHASSLRLVVFADGVFGVLVAQMNHSKLQCPCPHGHKRSKSTTTIREPV